MIITHGGTLPDTAYKADFYAIIDNGTGSAIVNADCSASMALAPTKLAQITTAGKVSGTALTGLASIPAGAGIIPAANLPAGTGKIIQVVNVQTGEVATGTTIIPDDNSIPQITEGDEYMTLAITPTSNTSKLLIEVVWCGSCSNTYGIINVALFQDSTVNSLAAVATIPGSNSWQDTLNFSHYMTSGTTSATTFRVRAGGSTSGTTTFNGATGTRLFGGVCASSITIVEIGV